jgi:hypothetical protein
MMTNKEKQCLLAYMDCLPSEDIDGLWGPQSALATAEMQDKLGLVPDGIWGTQTDSAIREHIFSGADLPDNSVYDYLSANGTFWDHIRYWTREEFRCQCGGKYCNGFPAEPDQTLVELADDIRHELGAPGYRSSGLRCPRHNANEGGVENSRHLTGKALDFRIEGKTGKQLLERALADKRTRYAYIIGSGPYVHVDVN